MTEQNPPQQQLLLSPQLMNRSQTVDLDRSTGGDVVMDSHLRLVSLTSGNLLAANQTGMPTQRGRLDPHGALLGVADQCHM